MAQAHNFFDSSPVTVTAAALTLYAEAHANKPIVADKADGITLTLPAALGTGNRYFVAVKTSITSSNLVVKVANATDVMCGSAILAQDAGDTVVMFATAADSDTITMNGGSKGGLKGASVEAIDIGAGLWWVRVESDASGSEATPFSAAV
jgi:hypothetical protein